MVGHEVMGAVEGVVLGALVLYIQLGRFNDIKTKLREFWVALPGQGYSCYKSCATQS